MEDAVETLPADTRLTFNMLWVYTHPAPTSIGPQLPVADYRIAAGLLFCQWNDNTSRTLHVSPGREWPHIEIEWRQDFGDGSYARIFVTPEVVQTLITEHLLEGVRGWGYTSKTRLVLNSQGKRRVFEEWFTSDNLMNLFAAGASVNINDGKVSWPR